MYVADSSHDCSLVFRNSQTTLLEYRQRANLTQNDLACTAHVSLSLIKAIENGSLPFGRVELEKAIRIARVFKMNVEDFIFGSKFIF